jgi:hypothetical protein
MEIVSCPSFRLDRRETIRVGQSAHDQRFDALFRGVGIWFDSKVEHQLPSNSFTIPMKPGDKSRQQRWLGS